jgi:hypothetical protein
MPYLPEVCTTSAAPATAVNQGSGTQSWANPAQALSGTTGSTATIPTPADNSVTLRCSNGNVAAYAPIADDAIITKFIVTWDVRGTRTGSFQPNYEWDLYDGTTTRDSGPAPASTPTSFTPVTQTFAAPFINGATISGAQLKAGNFGVGFKSQGSNPGSIVIRNVRMSVCYQNPDVPAGGGLLFSEA